MPIADYVLIDSSEEKRAYARADKNTRGEPGAIDKAKGQTMNMSRKPETDETFTCRGTEWRHPRERTGVRFILANATDLSHADDYRAWYDEFATAIIRPGAIANAFRFENRQAAGTETDPRYAAIYDLVTPDPGSAWPATENSPDYPRQLLADPRTKLVAPVLQSCYATTGSIETDDQHGALTGVHIILSDGGTDAGRQRRAAPLLKTGLFYCASRFRIIDGSPDPPAWLEVFETGVQDALSAYARACDAVEPRPPADGVRQRISRSFALVAAHGAGAPARLVAAQAAGVVANR
jgi:hypothetical protein